MKDKTRTELAFLKLMLGLLILLALVEPVADLIWRFRHRESTYIDRGCPTDEE